MHGTSGSEPHLPSTSAKTHQRWAADNYGDPALRPWRPYEPDPTISRKNKLVKLLSQCSTQLAPSWALAREVYELNSLGANALHAVREDCSSSFPANVAVQLVHPH